ncbi:MAG: sulfurtransferase complex subunit TusB [Shewanella algae]
MILHHIQTSAARDTALSCALRYAGKTDVFLLAGDAVSALLKRQWAMALSPFKVVLVADDVKARGLEDFLGNYEQLDYPALVALTLAHTKVISW